MTAQQGYIAACKRPGELGAHSLHLCHMSVPDLKVAQHFYLMEQGSVSFSGNPGALAEDDVIQRAYLGQQRKT